MLTVICRHLMSSEYGPFDRFVELGVLLLIAYEVFVPMIQRGRQRRKYEGEMQSMIDCLSQAEASALRNRAETTSHLGLDGVIPLRQRVMALQPK